MFNESKETIEATVEETEDRQIMGYSLQGEKLLSCRHCNKPLINIIMVKDTPEIHKFKARCPCGSESWLVKLHGKKYYRACDPLSIDDIITNGEVIEFIVK